MSGFNSIWVKIVTLKLSLISDPVSGDSPQIVCGLRRRKKLEKWQAYSQRMNKRNAERVAKTLPKPYLFQENIPRKTQGFLRYNQSFLPSFKL